MSRVLVTDGDSRTALACARSLIAAGHEVWVVAASSLSLAGVSRGVRSEVVTFSALASPRAYAASISAACVRRAIEVLLPVSDASVDAVLSHRASIPASVRIPLPALAQFRTGADKARMLDHARRAGFAVPASLVIGAPEDAEAVIDSAAYPAILKPHCSVVSAPGEGARKLDVSFVADSAACRAALRLLPREAYPVLLQERIHGRAEGSFALRWNGVIVASFAHRRLREKPPAGGVSVHRESIAVSAALAAATDALLTALDWQGVAMIECIVDARTGAHVFTELNGRLWGSLQLAIDAGVDFPALLVACATGATGAAVRTPTPYAVGVRSRWFWGDVDHLYARLVKSPTRLQLDAPYPSRAQAVLDFLRVPFSRDRAEVGRWRDPLPSLLEAGQRMLPGPPMSRYPAAMRAWIHGWRRDWIPDAPSGSPAPLAGMGGRSRGPMHRRDRPRVIGG